jgi:hypothetical protein
MKYTHYLFFIILPIIFGLTGCGDDSVEVSLGYSYSDKDNELYQFDVIDSYGNDSEFDSISNLAISPYINGGVFDLFWDIRTDYDYIVDFRINTTPTLAGSKLVFSDYCDALSLCYDNQYLYCEYQSDFEMVCENFKGDGQASYIGDYIDRIPKTLYLILDTCNGEGFSCNYQAIPVLME